MMSLLEQVGVEDSGAAGIPVSDAGVVVGDGVGAWASVGDGDGVGASGIPSGTGPAGIHPATGIRLGSTDTTPLPATWTRRTTDLKVGVKNESIEVGAPLGRFCQR